MDSESKVPLLLLSIKKTSCEVQSHSDFWDRLRKMRAREAPELHGEQVRRTTRIRRRRRLKDGQCWALCSPCHNGVRDAWRGGLTHQRGTEALCPTFPVHPDTMKPATLMDSCGGKNVKVIDIDQIRVIFWWNKKGPHTPHLLVSQVFLFCCHGDRGLVVGMSGTNQGSGLMASPFGCIWSEA